MITTIIKQKSDRNVLSDEPLGTKLRVTENQCVLFDPSTYVYLAEATTALNTLCQFGRLYVHTHIYNI